MLKKILIFGIQQAQAALFGGFLLFLIVGTHYYYPLEGIIHVFDFLFFAAISFQLILLMGGYEEKKEFFIILLFHVLAMGMEIFKTSDGIRSWYYLGVEDCFWKIRDVPLFTGFMYSAVGSHITRSFHIMKLSFIPRPSYFHLSIISFLIYINFFTHHFIFDIRYIILGYLFFMSYRTKVFFTVLKHEYHMPFVVSGFLTAFFIWIAENIGTYTSFWRYPNQIGGWELVGAGKILSWFLLLAMSFSLVSLIKRNK
jgi:uncharacterized membrane protein YoaT (DUF817 family)